MKKNLSFGVLIIFLIAGCQPQQKNEATNIEKQQQFHPLAYAASYQQLAAEKLALEYQAYYLARLSLADQIEKIKTNKPLAVVLDIDETVLNNSPYEAMLVKKDTVYPAFWDEWLKAAKARPLSGVHDFLVFAKDADVEIFYITNRKQEFKHLTLQNLQKYNLPNADAEHLLMRTGPSGKKERRDKIAKDFHIAMLIGDNLNDFSELFEEKSNELRKVLVKELKEHFGTRFIVLPNTTYGDWEGALYNYDYSLSPAKKYQKMVEHLQGF
ncbi:MAG: 5'-nucleotidase, lipoprotein e(P4) family [Bacteroidales bacterium]